MQKRCGLNAQDALVIGGITWFVQWQKNPDAANVYYMLGVNEHGMGVQ